MRRSLLGGSTRPVRPRRALGSAPKHARVGGRPDRESERPGRLAWPLLANTRHVGAAHQVTQIAALRPRRAAPFDGWFRPDRSQVELVAGRRLRTDR